MNCLSKAWRKSDTSPSAGSRVPGLIGFLRIEEKLYREARMFFSQGRRKEFRSGNIFAGCFPASRANPRSRLRIGPSFAAVPPGHPLANQYQEGPRNRLVVKARLALGLSKTNECAGKELQRLDGRIPAQIEERHFDMIGVVKRFAGEAAVLESRDQFLIAHSTPLLLPDASVSRWLALESRSRS